MIGLLPPGGDSPGSSRCGARYLGTRLLTGMVCGRWQRPQPIEVSRRGKCRELPAVKLSTLGRPASVSLETPAVIRLPGRAVITAAIGTNIPLKRGRRFSKRRKSRGNMLNVHRTSLTFTHQLCSSACPYLLLSLALGRNRLQSRLEKVDSIHEETVPVSLFLFFEDADLNMAAGPRCALNKDAHAPAMSGPPRPNGFMIIGL